MKSIYLFVLLLLASLPAVAKPTFKPRSFEKNCVLTQPGVWFSKTEVAIGEYEAFIDWLRKQGNEADADRFAADDSVWLRDLSFNDPYAKYYNHHEVFKPYPVVGVSLEAAQAYCDYLTQTQGTARLKGVDGKVQTVQVRYRLPSPTEWERAACGRVSSDSTFINCYAGKIWYPRDHKGRFRFNHKLGKGDYAGWAGGDGHDYEGYMITAPSASFPPDNFLGLYNLAGNVAEMTSEPGVAKGGSWMHLQDDCRVAAVNSYDSPKAWLGFRVVAEVVR